MMRIILHKGLIDASILRALGRLVGGGYCRLTNRCFNALSSVRNPYIFFANHRLGLRHAFLVSVILCVIGVGLDPLLLQSSAMAEPPAHFLLDRVEPGLYAKPETSYNTI